MPLSDVPFSLASADPWFALCIEHEGNELIARECQNLTGAAPGADGFVRCDSVARVSQSAYVRWGARFIAHAPTLDDLAAAVAADPPRGDDFRVDFTRLGGDEVVKRLDAIVAVANVLPDYPNQKPSWSASTGTRRIASVLTARRGRCRRVSRARW